MLDGWQAAVLPSQSPTGSVTDVEHDHALRLHRVEDSVVSDDAFPDGQPEEPYSPSEARTLSQRASLLAPALESRSLF